MERQELLHYAEKLHHAIDHEMKGNLGDEITSIIKQHGVIAAGSGMIPVPVLSVLALVGNTWTMYVRINKEVGIPFEQNVMKSIATGVATNVAAVMPGMLIGKLAAQIAKAFPGPGTVAGIAINSATNYALTLVMGTIYVVALTKLFSRGEPITEENLKRATKETATDKSFVKDTFAAAKSQYKAPTSDASPEASEGPKAP